MASNTQKRSRSPSPSSSDDDIVCLGIFPGATSAPPRRRARLETTSSPVLVLPAAVDTANVQETGSILNSTLETTGQQPADAVIGEAISDLILLPELERPSLVDNLHRTDPTTVVLSSTVQHHAPPNCDGQDPNQVPSNNEIVTLGQPVVGQ